VGGGSVNNFYVEILTEESKTKLNTRKSKILYDKEANDFFFACFTTFFNHAMTFGRHFPTRQSIQTSPTACEPFRRATGRAPNDNPESGWSADNA